jgi:hypothetical protein
MEAQWRYFFPNRTLPNLLLTNAIFLSNSLRSAIMFKRFSNNG